LPGDLLARLAALEAENAALRDSLADARSDRDDWKAQAQTANAAMEREQATAQAALQALTNQQSLALPGALRDMPALESRAENSPRPWWALWHKKTR